MQGSQPLGAHFSGRHRWVGKKAARAHGALNPEEGEQLLTSRSAHEEQEDGRGEDVDVERQRLSVEQNTHISGRQFRFGNVEYDLKEDAEKRFFVDWQKMLFR